MPLSTTWTQVQQMLESGLSLIPVHDKGDRVKTPYSGWKEFQSRRIIAPELWAAMEKHNTEAVAIICGTVSGGLEIIDVDVKFKPGIDAILFSDIKALYPDLFNRLRIHKTPSGGFHILYRVADHAIPGNQKLAGRYATTDELAISPKPATRNFIETRGEGGYAVAPPSLNYSVHHDQSIPVITWEERCSLIQLCRTYTELVEVVEKYKPSRQDARYYEQDPFAHFNAECDPVALLEEYGWKELRHNSQFIWFTRPGKDKGVSASFNISKRVYYIFTSSTDFDEARGYNPASILSILAHNNDRRETHRVLVQRGYGRIRPEVEARMIKSKATQGKPLPANASRSAINEYDTERALIQSTYPHGIFWHQDDEGVIKISREHLYNVAEHLGYRLHNDQPVHISGYIATVHTPRQFYDALKSYIKEEDGDLYIQIANAFEAFIQRNGAFTISRLPILDTSLIVRDTSNSAYKFYQNGYLFITAQRSSFQSYDTLSGLIWSDQILPRQYNPGAPGGRFREFIDLACGDNDYTRKIIGYLAHQYKDETTGYIIVLTESCPDPKQGGGSGKNIFSSSFGLTTTYKSIPGSQVKHDEKFLNAWSGERIFAVSDVEKRFNFGFLKELSTGAGILKKLFKDEVAVDVADMPKFIIQSNYSFETTDGGLRRRIIPLEFGDHFTQAGGVDVHFGVHFPRGWDLADWTGYDNLIAECIRLWLAGGLKLFPVPLTEGGWRKQFEQTYGHVTATFIDEMHETWWTKQWIRSEDFKNDLNSWLTENNITQTYRPSLQKIHDAIAAWCLHYVKQFHPNFPKKEMGVTVKYKWFGNQEDAPF